MELDLSNHVDRMIFMGSYEALNSDRFRRILAPGMTVVDVGANIGYFTLLSSSLVGKKGKVFAVEPHPQNLEILRRTAGRNGLSQVHLCEDALGEAEGESTITLSHQSDLVNRSASILAKDSPHQSFKIRVRTLDECMESWGIQTIDLLKIDVDGFETRVLMGAQKALQSNRIRNIIIEYDEFWLKESGTSSNEISKMIQDFGYEDLSSKGHLKSLFIGTSTDRHFAAKI